MDLLSSIKLPHWLMIVGTILNSDKLPWSCLYPEQANRDQSCFKAACTTPPDAAAAKLARFFAKSNR